eukprot:3402479-Pleurochrysis_carterae.AAC.1
MSVCVHMRASRLAHLDEPLPVVGGFSELGERVDDRLLVDGRQDGPALHHLHRRRRRHAHRQRSEPELETALGLCVGDGEQLRLRLVLRVAHDLEQPRHQELEARLRPDEILDGGYCVVVGGPESIGLRREREEAGSGSAK